MIPFTVEWKKMKIVIHCAKTESCYDCPLFSHVEWGEHCARTTPEKVKKHYAILKRARKNGAPK